MDKKELKETLQSARALIRNPKNWTQGTSVRNAHGTALDDINHPNACSFCLFGAIKKVNDYNILEIIDFLAELTPCKDAIEYNDTRSHRSVIRLLDKAIANV